MSLTFELNLSDNLKPDAASSSFSELQDVTIIGAGPAGLSAAIYAQRKGLKTLVVGSRIGGQVLDTSAIENYPGFSSISGEGLVQQFQNHIKSLQVTVEQLEVAEISTRDHTKILHLTDGREIRSKTIIIASGSHHRQLGVPGEGRLKGRGVVYCAICDGPFFQDRRVMVAGGGNAAVEAVIDLAKIAKEVIIVHRSQLRADDILIKRMQQLENVEIYLETTIEEILGDTMLEGIRVLKRDTGEEMIIQGDGLFIEIGYQPNTTIFQNTLNMNEKGEIIVDSLLQTSISGIFAAGDVAESLYKQVVISAGDGAKAALAANDYINHLQIRKEHENASTDGRSQSTIA